MDGLASILANSLANLWQLSADSGKPLTIHHRMSNFTLKWLFMLNCINGDTKLSNSSTLFKNFSRAVVQNILHKDPVSCTISECVGYKSDSLLSRFQSVASGIAFLSLWSLSSGLLGHRALQRIGGMTIRSCLIWAKIDRDQWDSTEEITPFLAPRGRWGVHVPQPKASLVMDCDCSGCVCRKEMVVIG